MRARSLLRDTEVVKSRTQISSWDVMKFGPSRMAGLVQTDLILDKQSSVFLVPQGQEITAATKVLISNSIGNTARMII